MFWYIKDDQTPQAQSIPAAVATGNMRLSWWLGRLKRCIPCIVLLLVLYFIHQATKKSEHNEANTRRVVYSYTRLPPPPPAPKNQWFITEIHDHPEVCTRVAMALPDWIILLVGVKAASNYSHSRCKYMATDDAKHFAESSGLQMSSESFHSILPIAFLYALKNGATVIYIPSNNADLKDLQMPPVIAAGQSYEGLTYAAHPNSYFDPNIHFGCNVSNLYTLTDQSSVYHLCEHTAAPVIQAAASVGPLLPVIASQIENSLQQDTIDYCDETAPAVSLKPGTFSPLQLFDTVFLQDAFWALPIFTDMHDTKFQEVWSLIVQKLVWTTTSSEEGSSNKVMLHSKGISDLVTPGYFERTKKITQFLHAAVCETHSFRDCAVNLLNKLEKNSFVSNSIVRVFTEWLNALVTIGYKFPEVVSQPIDNDRCSKEHVVYHPINYTVHLVTKQYRRKAFVPVANVDVNTALYHNLCDNVKTQAPRYTIEIDLAKPWQQYENVLLVVVFNKDHYESLPYVETLYRSFFPNMLFCGPGHPDLQKFPGLKDLKLSFVSYGRTPERFTAGAFNYECMAAAMSMGYNVQGYLAIADDVLLPVHPLQKKVDEFSQNIWFLTNKEVRIGDIIKLRECRLGMCDFYPHWNWWEEYRPATIELFYTFQKLQKHSPLVRHCYDQLKSLNGAEFRPCGAWSDIYYIPQRLARDFQKLAKIFLEHKVFLEIAVPTIIRCLELPEDTQELQGKQLWEVDRILPWIYFTPQNMVGKNYLHPTKWSGLSKAERNATEFYCSKVMPFMHDRYARFSKT